MAHRPHRTRGFALALIVFAFSTLSSALFAAPSRAWEFLANDAFAPGDAVHFQAGFIVGETAAARFTPAGPCPCRVDAVEFLFGGTASVETVTVRIWDDSAGTDAPGAQLYAADFTLTTADVSVQLLPLGLAGVMVSGPFRIGIEFQHGGPPSVASDIGDIQPNANFVDASGLGWVEASTLGVTGDWVIRAVLDLDPSTPLANDTWLPNQPAVFQGGFVTGESAAVRLVPVGPCPCQVERIQFLFGGAATTHSVTLNVWDDSAGTASPGALLYSGSFPLTGSDLFLQEIDLTVLRLMVAGPIRVGLQFSHSGFPSVARDTDGIGLGSNFIDAQGLGWFDSFFFGLTGDWILRAVVDEGAGELVANDTWLNGQAAAFQAGFVAGETAAVRLVPVGPCPCTIDRVQFLFGGAASVETVTLRIWDDSAGTPAPGPELYANTYDLAGTTSFLQEIDLSVVGLSVNGPFRVGFEFGHGGPPSVAADTDGIHADRNFIDAAGLGWVEASTLAVSGDWIVRAVLDAGATALAANDAWISDGTQTFEASLDVGETAAARIVPVGRCPCPVEAVRFGIGDGSGGALPQVVTLHVWDDSAGTDAPGVELYRQTLSISPSDAVLQRVDLRAVGLSVSGPFRVGIRSPHAGLPSVWRDGDGLTAGRNFIEDGTSGWGEAALPGGDFVIRATLAGSAAVPSLSRWGAPGLVALLATAGAWLAGHRGRARRLR